MMKSKVFFLIVFIAALAQAEIMGPFLPGTVAWHHLQNPMANSVKEDGYWDLAWHAKAADYGDADSQMIIAKAYENGEEGVDRNMVKALLFYKKAAAQKKPDACMRLGQLFEEGKLVPKDKKEAVLWYTAAARTEFIPAQLRISEIYQQDKNYVPALYWLEKAAGNMFPNEQNLEVLVPDIARLRRLVEQNG